MRIKIFTQHNRMRYHGGVQRKIVEVHNLSQADLKCWSCVVEGVWRQMPVVVVKQIDKLHEEWEMVVLARVQIEVVAMTRK
jgi:hypothetical protein